MRQVRLGWGLWDSSTFLWHTRGFTHCVRMHVGSGCTVKCCHFATLNVLDDPWSMPLLAWR